MKQISHQIKFLIAIAMGVVIMTSCSTTEKFNITSSVPTNVTYASVKKTREIKSVDVQSGIPTQIEIPSNMYLGYVVAKDPATGLEMPVGLNLHKDTHKKNKTLGWLGWSSFIIGPGIMIGGAFTSAPIIMPIGAAYLLGVGLYGTLTWGFRVEQISYVYQFGYDKEQMVDFSGLSTKLLYPDPPKNFEGATASALVNGTSSAYKNRKKPASTNTLKASKIKAKDAAALAAGTYSGRGRLLLGKEVTDTYSDVELMIEKVSKNLVEVKVISDGEEIFEEPLRYQVKKNQDGSLYLQFQGAPMVFIRISRDGHATFSHKFIEVDSDIYTLNIEADKR